jgi:hypothetical protein
MRDFGVVTSLAVGCDTVSFGSYTDIDISKQPDVFLFTAECLSVTLILLTWRIW